MQFKFSTGDKGEAKLMTLAGDMKSFIWDFEQYLRSVCKYNILNIPDECIEHVMEIQKTFYELKDMYSLNKLEEL